MPTLVDRLVARFPAATHPVTLVRDPDGLLADEAVLAVLGARGFTVVREADPVLLRLRVEAARPWSSERPLVVATEGPLNALPYDLWREGNKVELGLHAFFPALDYPTVRSLGPARRERLSRAALPDRQLAQGETRRFVLRHAFGADPVALAEPAALVLWLAGYHQDADPMPPDLASDLVERLRRLPVYAGWDLASLLADPAAFAAFVEDEWRGYVGRQLGRVILQEERAGYLLDFGTDEGLQDGLGRLRRLGVLEPVAVGDPARLPEWARPAVLAEQDDRRPARFAEVLERLREALDVDPLLADARWPAVQGIARAWADLRALQDDLGPDLVSGHAEELARVEGRIDAAFLAWLSSRYAALAGQRVPTPHHVHHVPEAIAFRRRRAGNPRVALLVLDGMALRDWLLVAAAWRARNPGWRVEEEMLLAQVPTITAVSRQALVSGLRPADFADTITHNRVEDRLWARFWARHDLPAAACAYARLRPGEAEPPPEVMVPRIRAACLVASVIDDIVHGSTLGSAGVQTGLHLWLDRGSAAVEAVVGRLLDEGFVVYVASDHGHVQATGVGAPSQGVLVESRGARARTYRDVRVAEAAAARFGETLIWGDDGLLPSGFWALLPRGRTAFVPRGETVVSHGGAAIDEVVVPFAEITIG